MNDEPTLKMPMGWPDYSELPETSSFIVMVPDGGTPCHCVPVPGGPLYNPARPGPVGQGTNEHQILGYQMAYQISCLPQYQDQWIALWSDYIPYAWCAVAFRNGKNATREYFKDDLGGGWTDDEIADMMGDGEDMVRMCRAANVPAPA